MPGDAPSVTDRLRRAGLVAGAAYVAQAPYLVYLTRVAYPQVLARQTAPIGAEDLLAAELVRITMMVVLASLIGAFLSSRNGLPDLGTPSNLRRALPWIVGAGVVAIVGQLLGGGRVAAALPGQYPCALHWALAMMVKGAVFDEVIARYGMMTIAVGVFRRAGVANLLQAIFFAAVGSRALFFEGGAPGLDPITIASVGTAFLVNLATGHVYARHGLIAAMALHLVVGLRFPLHALTSAVCAS